MSSDRPGTSAPPPLPWLDWTPGERVVVRYRTDTGTHEALGELLETQPDAVRIATRRGEVEVHASTMVVGKRVPIAAPPRRRPVTD